MRAFIRGLSLEEVCSHSRLYDNILKYRVEVQFEAKELINRIERMNRIKKKLFFSLLYPDNPV